MWRTLAALAGLAGSAAAQDPLAAYMWQNRPIVVFADSAVDPAFVRQLELLADATEALVERDVVILTDTDPAADGPLRQEFHPRGFQVLLIGKDGGVKLRRPVPQDGQSLMRLIDRMPIRQQEIEAEQRSEPQDAPVSLN